jgi:hypothetical protein
MLLIKGFVFLQISILGQCFPPKSSIDEILNELEDEDDICKFITISNSSIAQIDRRYNPHLYMDNCLREYDKSRANASKSHIEQLLVWLRLDAVRVEQNTIKYEVTAHVFKPKTLARSQF